MPSVTPAMVTLDEDTQDDILYLARTNSLAELQEDLDGLATKHASTPLAILVNIRDANTGNSPAHLAAANGHVDILKYLQALSTESNVLLTARNATGSTPLHYAAVNAKIDAVKALVEAIPKGPHREEFILAKNDTGRDAAGEAENAGRDGWEEAVGFLWGSIDSGQGDEDANEGEEADQGKEADVQETSEELANVDLKS